MLPSTQRIQFEQSLRSEKEFFICKVKKIRIQDWDIVIMQRIRISDSRWFGSERVSNRVARNTMAARIVIL